MTTSRTYLCLPGAWMGAWTWQFVLERLRAAGHDARALSFRGVGERAAELAPDVDNDVFLADTLDYLECEDLNEVVLVWDAGFTVLRVERFRLECIGRNA